MYDLQWKTFPPTIVREDKLKLVYASFYNSLFKDVLTQ